MPFNIIHLVDTLVKVNYGIYNAALFASYYLYEEHSVYSRLWVGSKPASGEQVTLSVPVVYLGEAVSNDQLSFLLKDVDSTNTVFVSHGCWRLPTQLGFRLKKRGYKWIYTPHGMLEPWSMEQKKLKKLIYFYLFERRYAKKADAIRAVSSAEQGHLQKMFLRQVPLVENGIQVPEYSGKPEDEISYLFMARLHHKKGLLPLVNAWTAVMLKEKKVQLIIAGPDEGELEKIRPLINDNITYAGALYGQQKEQLLKRSHYFILPSFSEGFPTSVVEAMGFGLIPIISKECNFPQVFENELGYQVNPDEEEIANVLHKMKRIPFDNERSKKNHSYILQNNSEPALGKKLFELYTTVRHQK